MQLSTAVTAPQVLRIPWLGFDERVFCLSSSVCQINISHKQARGGIRWAFAGKACGSESAVRSMRFRKVRGCFGFLEVTFEILAT